MGLLFNGLFTVVMVLCVPYITGVPGCCTMVISDSLWSLKHLCFREMVLFQLLLFTRVSWLVAVLLAGPWQVSTGTVAAIAL